MDITSFLLANLLNGCVGLFMLIVGIMFLLLAIKIFNRSTPKFKMMELINDRESEIGKAVVYSIAIVISSVVLGLSFIISATGF